MTITWSLPEVNYATPSDTGADGPAYNYKNAGHQELEKRVVYASAPSVHLLPLWFRPGNPLRDPAAIDRRRPGAQRRDIGSLLLDEPRRSVGDA